MTLTDLILQLAGSPWVYVVLAVLLIIDGFFPFVPGETSVGALSALAASMNGASGSGPSVGVIFAVAVVATVIGDLIAFLLGRRIGVQRWKWMRRPRMVAAFGWAQRGLVRQPVTFFLASRFVPVSRVAVTMTAGATGFAVRRFFLLSVITSSLYTFYHVAIGYLAGTWVTSHPLLAVAVAIASVLVVGLVIDRAVTLGTRWIARRKFASSTSDTSAPP